MEEVNEKQIKLDSRRNHYANRKKLYEEMLLKEIPGTSLPNQPMHAVLEGELESSEMIEGHEAQNVRNHALIHYLATLANSNKTDDTFDFDFVESLLENGADVNSTDKTGQTVFHEVARSWNVDVACFLIKHGATVNHQDHFGRSPLHVAAAVDYAEMVEFLVQNGADVDIQTYGEKQAPVHFAAKNDAINSLKMLLGYGANIDARDSKNRTPLQVSAEMNRCKAAKLLVSEGAPAGVYDNSGNSALTLLIEKIPDVALEALNQFHSTDTINRKEFYFLSYLEGAKLKDHKTSARTPLQIAVQNERFDVILHPVMQYLISVKWQMYGKWGAVQDLVLNLLYTILWTVMGVTTPRNGKDLYIPLQDHAWRLAIGAVIILLTLVEVKKQIENTTKTRRELKKWREWRAAELEQDIQYCHPRWPQETHYLESEIKAVRNMSLISASDWWIYFDWIALVLILATITSHVIFFHYSTDILKEVHHHTMIALLLILWFRIFKYARPFESAGPFVVIFGSVTSDIIKWGFLNSVIVVPYTCAFWITFGGISLHPVKGYDAIGPLLYNMFSMMVVNPHDYDSLEEANPVLARLLCGSFIGIAAIVTLNLLIALLSNTFERLHENGIANAVMQRAHTILLLQKSLRKKHMNRYYNFITKNGSPAVIQNDLGRILSTTREERVTIDHMCDDMKMIKNILGDRFGRRYGKGRKSDLDFVKEDLCKVKSFQEKLVLDMRDMKIMLQSLNERTGQIMNDKNNTTDTSANVNNTKNTVNDYDDTNNMDNDKKVETNLNDHGSTSSAAGNNSPNERLWRHVRQKSEQNSEDDLDTDDSRVACDTSRYSEDIDGKRKQNEKGITTNGWTNNHQRNKKKTSLDGRHKNTDHSGDERTTRNKEHFVYNLPNPTTRGRTNQRFSWEMTRQGPQGGVCELSPYPYGSSQPFPQVGWEYDIPDGMAGYNYSTKSTQTLPCLSEFPPVHDPGNQSVPPGYLSQQSSQLKPHFTKWDPRLPREQPLFMRNNPQEYHFTYRTGPRIGYHDDPENSNVTVNLNTQPSLNDIQQIERQGHFRERSKSLENGKRVDDRIYQPVVLLPENTMIYPSRAQNFQKSPAGRNFWYPTEFHDESLRRDGRDGQRLNQFSSHTYKAERLVQGHSGFLNDRPEQGTREGGPFRSSGSGRRHFALEETAPNGNSYNLETIREISHQPYALASDSNRGSRLQHLQYTQQDTQTRFPESVNLCVRSPELRNQRKHIHQTHDRHNKMVSVQTPVTGVPEGTPLQDRAATTLKLDDKNSENQTSTNFSNPNELSKTSKYDLELAQPSKRSPIPIFNQNQFPCDNITEERETGEMNPFKGATPIAPVIMGKVVYFEKKIGEAENNEQRSAITTQQDRQRINGHQIPVISQVSNAVSEIALSERYSPLNEIQDEGVKETRDKDANGLRNGDA